MFTLHFSTVTGYLRYSIQAMDKMTLGNSVVLGIRHDFFQRVIWTC